MKRLLVLTPVLTAIIALSGCVSYGTSSGSTYSARQTMNEQSVRYATVEHVREVRIEKGSSGVGTATGAALGGLAANAAMGKGNGAIAAGIVGAVAGGIIGQNVEKNAATDRGIEITVRLENGELRAITQEYEEVFQVGQRVRLLSDGRRTRVTH